MKHLNVASKGKRAYVKKYATVVLCAFTLLVIVLASAGRGNDKNGNWQFTSAHPGRARGFLSRGTCGFGIHFLNCSLFSGGMLWVIFG